MAALPVALHAPPRPTHLRPVPQKQKAVHAKNLLPKSWVWKALFAFSFSPFDLFYRVFGYFSA
jgi:hypothetical protein